MCRLVAHYIHFPQSLLSNLRGVDYETQEKLLGDTIHGDNSKVGCIDRHMSIQNSQDVAT